MNEIKILGVERLSECERIEGKIFKNPAGDLIVEVPEGTVIGHVLIKPVTCDYGVLYS